MVKGWKPGAQKAPGFQFCLSPPFSRAIKAMPISSCWKILRVCGLALLGSAVFLPAQVGLKYAAAALSPVDIQSPGIIRVSSNLIMVPVSATDAEGRAVGNLKKEDFQLAEDGNREAIARMAEAGQSSLQLALLFDLSTSVHHRFDFEKQAATRFLQQVWKPGDAVTIIAFNEGQTVRLRNSQSLTEALEDLSRLQPTESATAFYDTVVMSARLLRESATPETRQAEIVLSDGEDNRSDSTIADALREVQLSNTIFYSINPGGNSIRLNEISVKGQQDLIALANQTGGAAFVSTEPSNLDEIFGRIATELRAQYLLSYYSSNSNLDGKFRRIEVSVPGRSDLRIHARHGYYAVKK
jgi:Ca-activated chloride channel family protein